LKKKNKKNSFDRSSNTGPESSIREDQFEITQQRIDLYGRIFKDVLPGWPPLVWVTRPEVAETLYRNEGRFPNRMTTQSMMMQREKRLDIFKHSAGLVLDNGEAWWRIRSKAQQPLLKNQKYEKLLADRRPNYV
jgi:hypothetical protein